ncbi:MAG TPA: glycosyltransferase family 4 protein [Pyrinomonadaceae bacterium]|nr:glycosyltransferase family 4 protein [Pyrinomonadaceae bacterium]
MKILQICSARELGGGEKHLADLANELARRGHDMFAAIIPASPLGAELSSVPGRNVIELPMRNSLNVAGGLKLARFVRQNEIEIVHAHMARDYPLAAFVARRAGAHLVLTRHVLFPLSRIHKLTLRRTSRVIAVSKAVADGLRAQKIFEPDTIVCIHNGIDLDRFEKSRDAVARADSKLRVGMIGHLAPIKGQEDFIRASAALCSRRGDVEFIIAGEDKSRSGDNRRRLEKLVDDLGLGEHISLVGWVDDIATLLATFDLFVSPSRSEPFGLSIVEAMAAGVPVLATSSEGAREIIEDGDTGLLVPLADAESLAKAMDQILTNPKLRQRLSENARRVARERFSLGRMVEATEQVYRETGVKG